MRVTRLVTLPLSLVTLLLLITLGLLILTLLLLARYLESSMHKGALVAVSKTGVWRGGNVEVEVDYMPKVRLQKTEGMGGVMAHFREQDKPNIELILNMGRWSQLPPEEVMHLFYRVTAAPTQGVCSNLRKMGGEWLESSGAEDGGKYVCMDDSRIWKGGGDCLVYSFGISTDWSFEDAMDGLGCSVQAFDPTVSYPSRRGRHITFTQLGLANRHRKLGPGSLAVAVTLDTILASNSHNVARIDYLKVDIEGWEVEALEQWISSGALLHVAQLGLELHTSADFPGHGVEVSHFPKLMTALTHLYRAGFRLISYHPNLTAAKTNGHYQFFEVVFMQDVIWAPAV